jgi:hypothetical protein
MILDQARRCGQDAILPGSRWRAFGQAVLTTAHGNSPPVASTHIPSLLESSSSEATLVTAGRGDMPSSEPFPAWYRGTLSADSEGLYLTSSRW